MTKVAVYQLGGNSGAHRTCPLMAEGARKCGDTVSFLKDTNYCEPDHDVAVFWGFVETCQAIMKGYVEAGKKAVYLDMGYWQRSDYFKVAVNARHPTAYFRNVKHGPDRRLKLGIATKQDWALGGKDKPILVAGMGAKAAWAEKLEPAESWERAVVAELRLHTNRNIIYRPKPSWGGAKPIRGTRLSPSSEALGPLLAETWTVVTHHSNVAVEGLVWGVPCFAWYGVAATMGLQDLANIEQPYYPSDREQWLNDVTYCQWSRDEMKDGTCWRHLKNEGLVP